jgi:WD40 repeat protein
VSLDDEVYLAIQSSSISVWRGQDGSHVRALEGHTGVVWVVAADGRENKVYSGSADHTVRVWAGGDSSGACTRVLEGHTDDVRALAIGVDGKVYSGSDDCSIRVWAGDDGAHLNTLVGHVQGVTALVCSPQGTVYSGSEDNTIRAWSGADGALLRTLQGHTGEVFSMACCPDGRLVSVAADSTLRVWSCEHDLNRPLATVTERAEDVVICGANGLVYSTGECGGISVW